MALSDSLTPHAFVARWQAAGAAERANYALCLIELCDILGVPHPEPASDNPDKDVYVFEREVLFRYPDGSTSLGRIDLYKRGAFVLEAKQARDAVPSQASLLDSLVEPPARRGAVVRGTAGWDDAMLRARGQAESYARALPTKEGWPPFLVVVDVGHVIELFADFSGTGKYYSQFPDASSFRIPLTDLTKAEIRERLALVWLDPQALDPSKRTAKATSEIAERLAALARSLERAGHNPKRGDEFLMRCLFTMFAEDVGLLRKDAFRDTMKGLIGRANKFAPLMHALWTDMNKGGFSAVLQEDVLRFNGGLFQNSDAIDISEEQLALLIAAADADWQDVEPAIFGTLLERALDPLERHRLGAHYTPAPMSNVSSCPRSSNRYARIGTR